ncbi:unnamed protein product [Closterium sp. NIES-64]|nr:unnamed protein product [Closterium sp. NIES-64]
MVPVSIVPGRIVGGCIVRGSEGPVHAELMPSLGNNWAARGWGMVLGCMVLGCMVLGCMVLGCMLPLSLPSPYLSLPFPSPFSPLSLRLPVPSPSPLLSLPSTPIPFPPFLIPLQSPPPWPTRGGSGGAATQHTCHMQAVCVRGGHS